MSTDTRQYLRNEINFWNVHGIIKNWEVVLSHLCKKMLSVFLEKGVHRPVPITQMVKQVIRNDSTQNALITEWTIKRLDIYFQEIR